MEENIKTIQIINNEIQITRLNQDIIHIEIENIKDANKKSIIEDFINLTKELNNDF